MIYNYNDYELLYLIKEQNEKALNILINKYIPLIYSIINRWNINYYEKEDYFQEGLYCLNIAINTFSDKYNKTFTKYFELIWNRRIISLVKSKVEYTYIDNIDMIGTKCNYLEEMVDEYLLEYNLSFLTDLEKKIFSLYYIDKVTIDKISITLDIEKKKI